MTGYMESIRKHVGHSPVLQCGASVIIFDENKRVLMMQRTDNDCWCFPGGGIELGEGAEETAKREVFEETGFIVDDLQLFGVFSGKDLYYKYPNGDEVYNIDIVYMTFKSSGSANINDESKGHKFFYINEIPKDISPPVAKVVESLIAGYENI